MNESKNPLKITYSAKHIESALNTLVDALDKAKRNPANAVLSFGELNTDISTLTCLLGKAKSARDGSVSFQDVDSVLPRVSYWVQRGMIETGRVRNILYVDSQPFLNKIISGFLSNQGYELDLTETAEEALFKIERDKPELVVLDDGLPGMGWMGLVGALRERHFCGKIILMTSEFEDTERSGYRKPYVDQVLNKPIGCNDLLKAVLTLTTERPRNDLSRKSVGRLRKPRKNKRSRKET